MKDNEINHLEEFQKIVLQQHENANKNINKELYVEILKTAEIIEKSDRSNTKEIVNKLRERFKNEDLNQVTDIFIHQLKFIVMIRLMEEVHCLF